MPHVAAAGPQRGEEPFPLARGDGRPPPGKQDDGEDAGRGGVEGEDLRYPQRRDDEARDGRAGRPRHVDADHVEPGRGGDLLPGHQFGDQRLPRRCGHGQAGAGGEDEGEEQSRRHHTQSGEHGQQDRDHDQVRLDDDHHPASVERVGQHTGGQCEQHHRQRHRRLDQRHDRRGVRVVDEQPLGTDHLAPHAGAGASPLRATTRRTPGAGAARTPMWMYSPARRYDRRRSGIGPPRSGRDCVARRSFSRNRGS